MPRNVNCIYINQQNNDCEHPKKKKRFGIFNKRCFVWVHECGEEECELNKKYQPLKRTNTTFKKDIERITFVKKLVVANKNLIETASSIKRVLEIVYDNKIDKIITSKLVFMYLKLYYENPNKKNHIIYNGKEIKIIRDDFATEDYIGWEE